MAAERNDNGSIVFESFIKKKFFFWWCCLLSSGVSALPVQNWVPHPLTGDTSIRSVSINGSLWVNRRAVPVTLEVACQADQNKPRYSLLLPQKIKSWDSSVFDANNQAQARHQFVELSLGHSRWRDKAVPKGTKQGSFYILDWLGSVFFAKQLLNGRGELNVLVEGGSRQAGVLEGKFDLPVSSALLQTELAYCGL